MFGLPDFHSPASAARNASKPSRSASPIPFPVKSDFDKQHATVDAHAYLNHLYGNSIATEDNPVGASLGKCAATLAAAPSA